MARSVWVRQGKNFVEHEFLTVLAEQLRWSVVFIRADGSLGKEDPQHCFFKQPAVAADKQALAAKDEAQELADLKAEKEADEIAAKKKAEEEAKAKAGGSKKKPKAE